MESRISAMYWRKCGGEAPSLCVILLALFYFFLGEPNRPPVTKAKLVGELKKRGHKFMKMLVGAEVSSCL